MFRKHTARKDYEELKMELKVDDWKDLIDHSKKPKKPSSSAAPKKRATKKFLNDNAPGTGTIVK